MWCVRFVSDSDYNDAKFFHHINNAINFYRKLIKEDEEITKENARRWADGLYLLRKFDPKPVKEIFMEDEI